MITKLEIDLMKSNKEAFMFWPTECQKWARENTKKFIFPSNAMPKTDKIMHPDSCYQLRPDFELKEPERWFYHPSTQELLEKQSFTDDSQPEEASQWIEVPADDRKYVEDCLKREDIGEFEYRKLIQGETVSYLSKVSEKTTENYQVESCDHGCRYFVRKPKPESGWREYEIERSPAGELCVVDYPKEKARYSLAGTWADAIDCGLSPQFSCAERPNDWAQVPVFIANGQPAMPAKMRVWMEGGAE